jgi:hypothetical protein
MKVIHLYVFSIIFCIISYSCEYNDLFKKTNRAIRLRYSSSHKGETRQDVVTGISWNLSFLGAMLPKGSISNAIIWESESSLILHLDRIGFNSQALTALDQLLAVVKESSEYKNTGGVDIGRFLTLTLTSSYHYYAITGVKKNLQAFRSAYSFDSKKAGIIHSTVSLNERVFEISTPSEAMGIAFIAQEGEGSMKNESFKATSFEVFDVMQNGQLRFAIYDSNGSLKPSADPAATLAGKPAKCLWCHEISLLPLFSVTEGAIGYYSPEEFETIISNRMQLLAKFRSTILSDIDFNKTQDHTFGELLYVAFMEPSAERLAREWQLPVEEVTTRLGSLPTHENHEFPFLGSQLYSRADVDKLAPFEVIEVPEDAREPSPYEPNFIHF